MCALKMWVCTCVPMDMRPCVRCVWEQWKLADTVESAVLQADKSRAILRKWRSIFHQASLLLPCSNI